MVLVRPRQQSCVVGVVAESLKTQVIGVGRSTAPTAAALSAEKTDEPLPAVAVTDYIQFAEYPVAATLGCIPYEFQNPLHIRYLEYAVGMAPPVLTGMGEVAPFAGDDGNNGTAVSELSYEDRGQSPVALCAAADSSPHRGHDLEHAIFVLISLCRDAEFMSFVLPIKLYFQYRSITARSAPAMQATLELAVDD